MNYLENFLKTQKNTNTQSSYRNTLSSMLRYVHKDVTDITVADLFDWKNTLSSYASSTQHQKIQAVKSFFGYLHEIEAIENNPSLKLKKPKLKRIEPDELKAEQIKQMIELATVRDKALLSVMLNTGLRIQSIIDISLSDFQNYVNFGKPISVVGKGDKIKLVKLSQETIGYIIHYLKYRVDPNGIPNLFTSKIGTPLNRKNTAKMIKKLAKEVGCEGNFYNHSVRAAAITTVYREYDIDVAKRFAGHSDPSTTLLYVRGGDEIVDNIMVEGI